MSQPITTLLSSFDNEESAFEKHIAFLQSSSSSLSIFASGKKGVTSTYLLLVESLVHLSGFESSVHLQPCLIYSIVSSMKRSTVMWKI